MEILTGKRGGRYYLDSQGKKHYLKKGKVEVETIVPQVEYKKYTVTVADYEHSGDLDHEIAHIKSICPLAINFKAWEEEDYEAESEYEQDYGECDEPIYQGYVSFEAPKSWDSNKYGIY